MDTKSIGEKIKKLRKEKKLTLKDVSEGTDLSISFLSQVERMQSSLTLESLKKISDTLGVNPSYFFSKGQEKEQSSIINRSFDEEFNATHFIYKDLSGNISELNFMPILVILKPGENGGNPFTHKGFEFLYILEGKLTVQIESKEYKLNPNDSIVVNSRKPHYWWNHTNNPVKFLCVSSERD